MILRYDAAYDIGHALAFLHPVAARGKQADDAGYDGTGARGAVIAFAWILTALFFFAGLLVYADR